MAIQTKNVAEFDNGLCVWQYDWDDSLLRLTQIRCTNNSVFPTRGTIIIQKNGRSFTALVAPGGSLNQALPTSPAARLEITVDSRGRVNGLDHTFEWGSGVV